VSTGCTHAAKVGSIAFVTVAEIQPRRGPRRTAWLVVRLASEQAGSIDARTPTSRRPLEIKAPPESPGHAAARALSAGPSSAYTSLLMPGKVSATTPFSSLE